MRNTTKWALGVTTVWLSGVAAYVICNWDVFLKMEPNAVGDFLAGTMSPLALFWLVAGYRQQGEELELNTKALLLQQKELAEQVKATLQVAVHAEQQAAASVSMVELTKAERQAKTEAEIAAIQPLFIFAGNELNPEGDIEFTIRNNGKDARNVFVSSEKFEMCTFSDGSDLLGGDQDFFDFLNAGPNFNAHDYYIDITYRDIYGNARGQRYLYREGASYLKETYTYTEEYC